MTRFLIRFQHPIGILLMTGSIPCTGPLPVQGRRCSLTNHVRRHQSRRDRSSAMWKNQKCTLTSKDFAILETMYDRRHTLTESVRQLLKHKLDNAVVMFCEDIDGKLVTLNTRLRYRVSDKPSQTAIVTQSPMDGMVGQCLSLDTERGLALLGLTETAEISLPRQESLAPDRLLVETILFQPEAARRERLTQESTRHSLRLVYDAGANG